MVFPFRRIAFLLGSWLLLAPLVHEAAAQARMENLGRGVVAIRISETTTHVSWRMLGTDPDAVAFNLYRSVGGAAAAKLNASPLAATTDYRDTPGGSALAAGVSYFVRPVLDGVEQAASSQFVLPPAAPAQPFLSVPIDAPPSGVTPSGESYGYTANDLAPADLDGDGEFELVVKWEPTNAKDNSQAGYTGSVFLDAYKLDGTRLWRIDLGRNIRAGAHYTQFIAYDLDSDGRAEVAVKTAPGTIDGRGEFVLLPGDDPHSDYRNSNGYILSGPEYLTVFDGLTGRALATTAYLPGRGNVSDWGDSYGNRVDRFVAGVAYLDGERPSLIMARGYYTQTHVVAWDWRDRALTRRWIFSAPNNSPYAGQGNHQLSVADVDGDGRQEIIYGAMTLNADGTGRYTSGLGHGDALHVSDFDPSRPGQEIFSPFESPGSNGGIGTALRDASTGAVIWSTPASSDVGRGVMMDIDPRYPGAEAWATNNANLYSATGEVIATLPSNMFYNFGVWWDADPLRELLDGTTISKWNHLTAGRSNLLMAWQHGAASNNGTKATPGLSGDILGDWREEVVWRNTDSSALLVFTTTTAATNRLRTFLHDPQYRVALAWQNAGYNQPPHPSFFVGHGMTAPPMPHIRTDAIPLPREPANLRWTGAVSGVWDSSSVNFAFVGDGEPTSFVAGDTVVIDDDSAAPTITLSGTLAPASLTVDIAQPRSLGGTGALGGVASLVKRGAGTFTVNTANTHGGGATLHEGTLAIGHAAALGTGPITLRGGTWATGALAPANSIVVDGAAAITGGHSGGNHGIRAVSGAGVITLEASSVFDLEGSFANFSGRVVFTGTGSFRFFGGAGSANADFDLGTRSLSARSGTVFTLGSLAGTAGSALSGSSGSGNNAAVTYTVGARGTDTAFAGAITNGNASTSLAKTGAGRLLLTGDNTHSGATTVSAGRLIVSGALGNSAVSVASGATFGGPGALGGSLNMASGARLALGVETGRTRGPAVAGVATLNGTITVVAEDLGGVVGAGSYTVLSFEGSLAGNPNLQWAAPSEAPYLAGSFSVAPGSITLTLSDTRSAFERWTDERFGRDAAESVTSPSADPDGDGMPNRLEYALGGDPLRADAAEVAPRVSMVSGERLALSFARIADPLLTYEVEATGSLAPSGTWTAIWSSTGADNLAGPVTVNDTGSGPTRFLRLRVRF